MFDSGPICLKNDYDLLSRIYLSNGDDTEQTGMYEGQIGPFS